MMKVLIKLITVVATLTLTACAPHSLEQPPQVREAFIHFRIVDEMPSYAPVNSVAVTKCNRGVCEMHILKEYYPECVTHEIGHVTHGDWHPDKSMHCRYGSNFK